MKTAEGNAMQTDWDSLHETEQTQAVIGKEMTPEAFWESGEEQYLSRIRPAMAPYLDTHPDAMTALEIGCGPGRLVKPLAARFGRVIGVDVSQKAVETASQNLRGLTNVEVIKGSGADLTGVEDAAVDVVVSFDVFQHMPTLDVQMRNLAEVGRVLRPGGVFVIQIKTTSGWVRWRGIPLLPRSLRPLLPNVIVNGLLAIGGYRRNRLKDTWRGHLIRHESVTSLFGKHGLVVKQLIPDGKGTRWIVVGKRLAPVRQS